MSVQKHNSGINSVFNINMTLIILYIVKLYECIIINTLLILCKYCITFNT